MSEEHPEVHSKPVLAEAGIETLIEDTATNEHDVAIAEANADAGIKIAQTEAAVDITEADAAVEIAVAQTEYNSWHEEHRSRLTALETQHQTMLSELTEIQSQLSTLLKSMEEPEQETMTEPLSDASPTDAPESDAPAEPEKPVVVEKRRRRWI